MANEFDQFDEPAPKELPAAQPNEFDQFSEPKTVNQFDAVVAPEEPKTAGQKAVDALMSTATKVATSGLSGAGPDLLKAQIATENTNLKDAPPADPIKFNARDLANPLQNPLNALQTVGKVTAREEATVAQGALDITKAALAVSDGGDASKITAKKYWDYVKAAPKTLLEGMKEGLEGNSRSDEDPTRQAQLGDVPRLLGAPEIVSSTLGLAASLALPSQLILGALPGPKYLSKAENLATNVVARNKWLAEFNAGVASLKEGKALIEKLVTQDLEPEAMAHLVQWRTALRAETDGKEVVKLLSRGEAKRNVLETVKGIKPTDQIGPIIASGVVEATPAQRAADLVRAVRETQIPISALESIFGGNGYNHVKLNPYKKVIAGVTRAQREHEVKLLDAMNPAVHGLTEASPEVQAKIRLYDLIKQGKNDPAAEAAAAVLGKKLGIEGTPQLTHQEKAFYAYAKKVVNEDKGVLAGAYKTVTGQDMKLVRDYVFPLLHEKESRTALQIFSEKLSTGGGGVIGGGTKRFVERTINDSMPRTDIFKLLDEQLQAQAWMKHVLPETRKARTAYMQPVYNKGLGVQDNEYIANLLNTVEHGGSSSPTSIVEKFLKTGRNNITKAMLAFKVSSALVQYGAMFDGMAMANQLWGGRGARSLFKSMQENLFSPKFEKNFSAAIANRRSMGSDAAVAEMSGAASSKIAQLGWAPMKRIDATVAQTVREGFKKALTKDGIVPKNHELDMLMEVVSGSPNVAMQPSIIHSNEFMRTWLTFQTFALARWSLVSHNLIEQGILAKNDIRNNNIAKAFSELTKPELFADKIKSQPFATLSAWKDGLSDSVNLKNMGRLEGTLKRMGYRYKRASGGWFDPASNSLKNEASLFVPGMSEEEAVALGKQFNQYSVFTPHGEIRSDGLVKKISNMNDVIIEKGAEAGRITADKLPFTEVKLGDQTIRFHVPQGKVQMIRPGTLTKHVQGHDVIQKKIRATIGLLLIAAADAAENKARSGIANVLSGNDNSSKQRSFGSMMMTALPSQIPFFGTILNAAMSNSSALPPVPRVIEGMVKGGLQTFKGKTGRSRAKGALNTAGSAVSLFTGMPGTSQIVQFLQNFIPEK